MSTKLLKSLKHEKVDTSFHHFRSPVPLCEISLKTVKERDSPGVLHLLMEAESSTTHPVPLEKKSLRGEFSICIFYVTYLYRFSRYKLVLRYNSTPDKTDSVMNLLKIGIK